MKTLLTVLNWEDREGIIHSTGYRLNSAIGGSFLNMLKKCFLNIFAHNTDA
jgi:hypothetical protein